MKAIEVQNLKRVFDGIIAVNDISFDVEEGEIFGFLGPNGAGKTTTVKMLTCQLVPSEGEAKVFGYDIRKECNIIRKIIGIVPQEASLHELLTAEQNIFFYGMLYDIQKKEIRRRAEELLSAMELSHRKKDLVKTFSGGMKQRLNLILALLHKPKLLFLDEPTTGLDPQARRRIWEFIKEINEQGTTIFLTTHYMEEADNLADRVAIIDNGKIISLGKPSELKRKMRKEKILEVEIEHDERIADSIKTVEGVKQLTCENGKLRIIVEDRKGLLLDIVRVLSDKNIKSLITAEPTLEDVFIYLTGKRLRD